jgi:hypothetical protein
LARSTFGAGRSAVKLEGSLRGTGLLIWQERQFAVSYQLDVFRSDTMRIGSGTLDGDLAPLAGEPAVRALLRLSDGFEIQATLSEADEHGAMFEASEPLPDVRGR